MLCQPDAIRLAFKDEKVMTQLKQKTMADPAMLAVVVVPDAKEVLSVEDIARAIGTHLEGQFHSLRHRYAEEFMHQQVQLETIHETDDGQRFRVITEYHEALTIVDLVDHSNTH